MSSPGSDLRQRYAEAIAAKFTSPVHRCDKWGENEWVENLEPSDRVGQSPHIVFTAGDGHPAFRTPTCAELAETVAAVRDEEMERLREERDQAIAHDRQPYPTQWAYDQACAALDKHRQRADEAEAANARVRSLAKGYSESADGLLSRVGDVFLAALDGQENRVEEYVTAVSRVRTIADRLAALDDTEGTT